MVRTLWATRRGSPWSRACGLPVSIWQKSQRRGGWAPPVREGGSRASPHSKMLGQPASWHTVCRPSDFTRFCSSRYCGPNLALVLIHAGFFSTGTAALRTSSRSILRPSGAGVAGALEPGSVGAWVTRSGYAATYLDPNRGGPRKATRSVPSPELSRSGSRDVPATERQQREGHGDDEQDREVRRPVGQAQPELLLAHLLGRAAGDARVEDPHAVSDPREHVARRAEPAGPVDGQQREERLPARGVREQSGEGADGVPQQHGQSQAAQTGDRRQQDPAPDR